MIFEITAPFDSALPEDLRDHLYAWLQANGYAISSTDTGRKVWRITMVEEGLLTVEGPCHPDLEGPDWTDLIEADQFPMDVFRVVAMATQDGPVS